MKLTIDIKAKIRDSVRVPALELRSAVIRSISIDTEGINYQIAYFHNGERKIAWVYADEFEVGDDK